MIIELPDNTPVIELVKALAGINLMVKPGTELNVLSFESVKEGYNRTLHSIKKDRDNRPQKGSIKNV